MSDIEQAVEIVAAYVSKNSIPPSALPTLLREVYAAIRDIAAPEPEPIVVPPPVPAIDPKKSVTPDYLVSLETGQKLKSLKRHIGALGMTPDQYRAKYGLKPDYPMVAPAYAKRRSELAKSLGLGRPKLSVDERVASVPSAA